MALDLTMLTNLGFPQVLLWLLSFAVVFGVLSQADIPKKQRGTQGIIAIVVAFLVLFSTPTSLITTLSTLSTNVILVILALITFIVFLEAAGVKVTPIKRHPGGVKEKIGEEATIFQKYSKYFAIVLIIVVGLLFVGAGGLNILGISTILPQTSTMTLLFFAVIVLAVGWLIANPEHDNK